ncbi:hypothetical protein BV25DRAFT_1843745 [Artomyces pyxidatus]|uniref:Uncharacterized protein n=1 Tax=Artomyces pyxidatus TaxID=48021 RepID=A0ACB8SEB2_9AGAM|nr:hypothetical protein BV25DRAFT_1843745 [Artomyces pyxidatus]
MPVLMENKDDLLTVLRSVHPDGRPFGSGVYYDVEELKDVEDDEVARKSESLYNHRLAARSCLLSCVADAEKGVYSLYQIARYIAFLLPFPWYSPPHSALEFTPAMVPGQRVAYPAVDTAIARWLPARSGRFQSLTIDSLQRPVVIHVVGRIASFQACDGHGLPLSTVTSVLLPAYYESRVAAYALLLNLSYLPIGMTFLQNYNVPVYAERSQVSTDAVIPEDTSNIIDSRPSTKSEGVKHHLHYSDIGVGDLVCQYMTVERSRVFIKSDIEYWRPHYRLEGLYLLAKADEIPFHQFT